MASDKKEKKEKKEKKHRASETDGVTKSKSDKKEKKDKKKKSKGVVEAILDVLPITTNGDAESEPEDMDVDAIAPPRVPAEALVPFANPLADDKQTKKLLKMVKKCKIHLHRRAVILTDTAL
jgi:H/ACA ribonucleoprotein complex subunit 2